MAKPRTEAPPIAGRITRQDAKAQRLKLYFTGQPCKHGHVCARYVSNGMCWECSQAHGDVWRADHPDYRNEWDSRRASLEDFHGDWDRWASDANPRTPAKGSRQPHPSRKKPP